MHIIKNNFDGVHHQYCVGHFNDLMDDDLRKAAGLKYIDDNWDTVMKETKGAWRKHPVFKDMDNSVEIVEWMRGKK